MRQQHGYNAACAAALAGCGQGEDAAKLDEKERTRLRKQALTWLRADLEAWRKQLQKQPDRARSLVQRTMQHWQRDADFARVRRAEAMGRLPEPERLSWGELWQAVEALRRQAEALANPPGPD